MFLNTQFETHGGDGWLRVVEFLEDGTTVRVRTYSPFWDLERPHPDFAFEFQISSLPPAPPLDGDYSANGVVDAADYVTWRKTRGTSNLIADGNGDLNVDYRDYIHWMRRFGNTSLDGAGQSSPVPEPSCLALLITSVILMTRPYRHRRS